MNFSNDKLKSFEFLFKIISLQCSLVRWLFDELFEQRKVTKLFFIQKACNNFEFYSILDFNK